MTKLIKDLFFCRKFKLFSETAYRSQLNFMLRVLGKMEHKICKNGFGHMTKMAAMPIILWPKKLLLKKTMSYDLESFACMIFGLKIYKACLNVGPGLTVTYLTASSNLVTHK